MYLIIYLALSWVNRLRQVIIYLYDKILNYHTYGVHSHISDLNKMEVASRF